MENMPIALSSVTCHLDDIRQIKNVVGGVCDHGHCLQCSIHFFLKLIDMYICLAKGKAICLSVKERGQH